MKSVFLIRHAKSSWSNPAQDDFERPLNERGLGDLELASARLTAHGFNPDRVFTSPAVRARSTAIGLMQGCDIPRDRLEEAPRLYLAGLTDWLTTLQNVENDFSMVAAVGHNPGITSLVEMLTGQSIGNLPTCGIALIEFDIPHWKDLGASPGNLAWLDYPKLHNR